MMSSENETALYRQIFQYIQSGNYPDKLTKSQKRSLSLRAQDFTLQEGLLFYKSKKDSQPRRWITDLNQKKEILESCHSDRLAGHFGRDKTREKVGSFRRQFSLLRKITSHCNLVNYISIYTFSRNYFSNCCACRLRQDIIGHPLSKIVTSLCILQIASSFVN